MTVAVLYKLLAILAIVTLGWGAGRMHWLGAGNDSSDPARVLSNAALYVFIPALLLRTTVRLDFAALPGRTVGAFFLPAIGLLLSIYFWQRRRGAGLRLGAAAPAVRAITASFGNSVQLGIPLAAALFGEGGLAIHVALISLHALILLSIATLLAELDLARVPREGVAARASLGATLTITLRNTVIHPVMLPVLIGLAWNASGIGLHPIVDETLLVLGSAVVPVCLVLIGLSLAYYGVQGHLRGALGLAAAKLVGLPALVLVVAHWGFGLSGLPLAVLVVMAALPVGSNPLVFAQRYDTLKAEATATIVFSTLAFVATLAGWLAVLAWIG
ncbi:MAG: AEC family transporter [Burkholderiaceae bacterium]|nr:AEC family transporter [Burkholderiaceae bacterium]